MKTTIVPASVTTVLDALRVERLGVSARLDAIDLAIENVRRVWPDQEAGGGRSRPRASRLKSEDDASSPAAKRRALLLTVIGSSADGLTTSDVRQQTPKMKDGDRSNALQQLKATKQIRRAGKRWIVAA